MGKGKKPYQNDGSKFDNDLESYSRGLYDLRDDISEELPKSNVIAKHMSLSKIIPDLLQPRHLVPAAARAGWDGTPDGIPVMLVDWHDLVEQRLGNSLDARQFIQTESDDLPDITVPDPDNPSKRVVDPVALGYIKTLQLAGSILKDGQRNPISVYRSGGLFVVETGERRLMACHLLNLYMGDEHDTVLATKIDQPSIWMQVKENNVREELNAIGQARSLALLVMDMYADEVDFKPYNELVKPGGSDKGFYEQVADGNEFRIKYGMGGDVQEAMGLTNRNMLSNYRNLLKIPDWLWVKADEENWTEFAIRSAMDEIEGTNRAGMQQKGSELSPTGDNVAADEPETSPIGDNVTAGDEREMSPTGDNVAGDTPSAPPTHNTPPHSSTLAPDDRQEAIPSDDDRERPTAPEHTRNGFAVGDRVYHDRHNLARIERVESHTHVAIRTEDGNRLIRNVHESELHPAVEDDPQQPHTPLPRDERPTESLATHDIPYSMGQYVSLDQNPQRIGKVVQIRADQGVVVARMEDNGEILPALVNGWNPASAPPPAPAAAINDLPPDVYEPLTDGVAIIEKLADIYEAKAPEDDITDVRDALQLVRTGTLEEMHSRTPEELEQQFSLLVDMLHHMTDIFHDGLMKALIDLNGRRNQ